MQNGYIHSKKKSKEKSTKKNHMTADRTTLIKSDKIKYLCSKPVAIIPFKFFQE